MGSFQVVEGLKLVPFRADPYAGEISNCLEMRFLGIEVGPQVFMTFKSEQNPGEPAAGSIGVVKKAIANRGRTTGFSMTHSGGTVRR